MNVEQLYQAGLIKEIDRAFARMLDRRLGGIDPMVGLAAALVSRATAAGDVCLDLAALTRDGFRTSDATAAIRVETTLEQWIDKLSVSPAVGTPHDEKPMILDGNRLYLQRYWKYENAVAREILDRCTRIDPSSDPLPPFTLAENDLFAKSDADQRRAVEVALNHRFAVISGGPGTGKTFTVAQIIAWLQQLSLDRKMRIRIAAPTGKAAARLQEALDQAFKILHQMGVKIPVQVCLAETIHRMLGAVPGKTRFFYNDALQLPADVVIVDEASMIDLALMAKLIRAVPASARLILVGDKDQLASVEAGAVLGDICAGLQAASEMDKAPETEGPAGCPADHGRPLADHIVVLEKNYRFDAAGGINKLGAAVNAGDADRTLALLNDNAANDIVLRSFATRGDMEAALAKLVMEKIAPAFGVHDPAQALRQINGMKILTPLRHGPAGVQALNQQVERILIRNDVIAPYPAGDGRWYSGRPVMIVCNDYYHNLFNGDMGIVKGESIHGPRSFKVFFAGSSMDSKTLVPEQLPAHETVYAMTVHKSQGTEFDVVVLVLPDLDVPLLTRELLYTAVTRARRRVEIWGRRDILEKAVSRRIRRVSGLRQALWPCMVPS